MKKDDEVGTIKLLHFSVLFNVFHKKIYETVP